MNSKVANIIRSVSTSTALLFHNLAGEKNHCDTTKEAIFLYRLLASAGRVNSSGRYFFHFTAISFSCCLSFHPFFRSGEVVMNS